MGNYRVNLNRIFKNDHTKTKHCVITAIIKERSDENLETMLVIFPY